MDTTTTLDQRYLTPMLPRTHEDYKIILRSFRRFVEGKGYEWEKLEWCKSVHEIFQEYTVMKKFASVGTFKNHCMVVQGFMRWLYNNGMYSTYITLDTKILTTKDRSMKEAVRRLKKDVTLISEADFIKVVQYCKQYYRPMYVPLLLMWNFGLRLSEIVTVKRTDFVEYNGVDYLMRFGKSQKKTGKAIWQRIPPKLMVKIKWHFQQQEKMGYGRKFAKLPVEEKYLVSHTYYNRFTNRLEFRGIPVKKGGSFNKTFKRICREVLGKTVNSHDIRRSRITSMVKKDVSQYDICKVVGVTLQNLQKYYDKDIIDLDAKNLSLTNSL